MDCWPSVTFITTGGDIFKAGNDFSKIYTTLDKLAMVSIILNFYLLGFIIYLICCVSAIYVSCSVICSTGKDSPTTTCSTGTCSSSEEAGALKPRETRDTRESDRITIKAEVFHPVECHQIPPDCATALLCNCWKLEKCWNLVKWASSLNKIVTNYNTIKAIFYIYYQRILYCKCTAVEGVCYKIRFLENITLYIF